MAANQIKQKMNSKLDFFFKKDSKWKAEYEKLRILALGSELSEEVKWGVPCYTIQKKNVVLIHGFNNYCALLFHKGVLLKDPEMILIQQTKNVQAARQIRFRNLEEIIKMEKAIKAYIDEAIDIEKAGLEVNYKKTDEFEKPLEFQKKLDEIPGLKTAFEALSPGRQRAYLLYFSQAKQSKTRESRIEKSIDNIFDGKGLND